MVLKSPLMSEKSKSIKQLVFGMAAYTSASIMGPLIIFGGTGYALDKFFGKYPFWTLILLGVAFIFTNILLFGKIKKLSAVMEKYGEEMKKKKKEEDDKKQEVKNGA